MSNRSIFINTLLDTMLHASEFDIEGGEYAREGLWFATVPTASTDVYYDSDGLSLIHDDGEDDYPQWVIPSIVTVEAAHAFVALLVASGCQSALEQYPDAVQVQ